MSSSTNGQEAALLHQRAAGPEYRLQVRIEPALHHLQADAWIRRPPASQFYLHRGFAVQQLEADGRSLPVELDPAVPPLPYVKQAAAFRLPTPNVQELHIRYGGELQEVVSGVNMIAADLAELACYCAWYPLFADGRHATFQLEANLPREFLPITNGRLREQREQDGRSITTWTSYWPGWDIVLLAAPGLQRLEGGDAGRQVAIAARRLSAPLLRAKIDGLVAGMERLTAWYGPPRVPGVLRLVYAPRGGWGYARMPLIVVSEERAEQVLHEELGEARDFADNAHELAHFWWSIADPSTPDDWINEGLAEFAAYRLTTERFGPAFAALRQAQYREHARRSRTSEAIAETPMSSADREVNRYDKATLMLLEAQRRFGQERLDALLRALYARFAGTGQATTAAFLDEAGKRLGGAGQAFFREELFRRPPVDLGDTATAGD